MSPQAGDLSGRIYIAAADIAADKGAPLFRTTGRATGTPRRMVEKDAYKVIERRARQAGIKTQNRQSFPARDRHHRLAQKRRLARGCAQDGEPCRHPHQELYDRHADVASLDEYNNVAI
jgi:hypothetical protein